MARIEPIHYEGVVWCVKVPTGAFVARRNGKVFITGNSGFPKSQNVSKMIDKAAGAEREIVGSYEVTRNLSGGSWADLHGKPNNAKQHDITASATPEAQQWDGWGTALKPALEPITVARKPLARGRTVAANVLEYGTGALNVDGCRVGCEGKPVFVNGVERNRNRSPYDTGGSNRTGEISTQGRWPANLIHSGCDEVVGLFPGVDEKSAARFMYCAKASKKDRGEDNNHPTVKPTDLMRYLCRLVTPPGGTVLDPFMGSGSTGRGTRWRVFNSSALT